MRVIKLFYIVFILSLYRWESFAVRDEACKIIYKVACKLCAQNGLRISRKILLAQNFFKKLEKTSRKRLRKPFCYVIISG